MSLKEFDVILAKSGNPETPRACNCILARNLGYKTPWQSHGMITNLDYCFLVRMT